MASLFRTAMESAAYGCCTIISKNGGLPETFKDPIFINKVDENQLYNKIKSLILNNSLRKKIQKYNFQNVVHTIEKKVKIDQWKEQNLRDTLHLKFDKLKKILHISTFDERNDHRLFNISISSKLTKGFIRNGHDDKF